jgi:cytidyltransferase-like protein
MLIYTAFRFLRLNENTLNFEQIFYDGCAVSFVTWEVLLNKMAKRDSGMISILALFTYYLSGFVGLASSLEIIIGYIREISISLNMNIFTQNVNVYCCGVYDLCHYGHKIMFKQALQYGTRLIVGVHNDAEVESYKRTPIMTMEERMREVESSKYVWKVVPDALLLISQKELDDLNIHVVVCCQDYYNDTDIWYDVPRKLGILKPIPYTKEISTTDLIKRCKNHV